MQYALLELWDMGKEWRLRTGTDTREEMVKFIQDNLEDLQEAQWEDEGTWFSIQACNEECITDVWDGDIEKLLKIMQEDDYE